MRKDTIWTYVDGNTFPAETSRSADTMNVVFTIAGQSVSSGAGEPQVVPYAGRS